MSGALLGGGMSLVDTIGVLGSTRNTAAIVRLPGTA